MEGASRKPTLEERLSLAAAKRKRKTKKQGSGSPAPIGLTSGQGNELPDTNEPAVSKEDSSSEKSRLPNEVKSTEEINGNHEPGEAHTFLSALKSSEPWKTWLPGEIDNLSAVELLKFIQPHVEGMIKQNAQQPKIDNSASSLVKVIKEKEETIVQLRQEGEKLSKVELKLSTNNKSLRKQVSDLEKKVEELQEALIQKSDALKDASTTVESCKARTEELQKQVEELQQEKADSDLLREKLVQTQNNLKESKAHLSMKNIELREAESKWQKENDFLRSTTREQILLLESNLEQLRIELETSKEGPSNFNEDAHWKEQYTVLRNEFQDSRRNWSALEDALNKRLASLENQLEEEKKLVQPLTNKLTIAIQEKKDMDSKLRGMSDETNKCMDELKKVQNQNKVLQRSLEDVTDDFRLLQKQFDIQKTHLEQKIESKGSPDDQHVVPLSEDEGPEDISNFEDEWILPSMISSIDNTGPPLELKEKLSNDDPECTKISAELSKEDLGLDISDVPNDASDLGSLSRMNGPRRHSSSINIKTRSDAPASNQMSAQMVSKLASEIRRFEVEVSSLKSQCDRVQKEKNTTNNELIRLMEENENLKQMEVEKNNLSNEVKALQSKLEASLQLLGEKAERAEELENDVQDLKDMMKQQIQDMMELRDTKS